MRCNGIESVVLEPPNAIKITPLCHPFIIKNKHLELKHVVQTYSEIDPVAAVN